MIFDDEQAEMRKAAKQSRDEQRRRNALRTNAVNILAKTPDGREYLRWLFEITGFPLVNPYTGKDGPTAYNCGALAVGQTIVAHILTVNPTLVTRLLQEEYNAGTDQPDPADTDSADADLDDAGPTAADTPAGYN